MAPLMSLAATILHNGLTIEVPLLWMNAIIKNFPMALFLQIFYVGPLVRLVFRTTFKPQAVVRKVA